MSKTNKGFSKFDLSNRKAKDCCFYQDTQLFPQDVNLQISHWIQIIILAFMSMEIVQILCPYLFILNK